MEELLAYEGDVEEDFGLTFQVVSLHYHCITLPGYIVCLVTRDCRSAVRAGEKKSRIPAEKALCKLIRGNVNLTTMKRIVMFSLY